MHDMADIELSQQQHGSSLSKRVSAAGKASAEPKRAATMARKRMMPGFDGLDLRGLYFEDRDAVVKLAGLQAMLCFTLSPQFKREVKKRQGQVNCEGEQDPTLCEPPPPARDTHPRPPKSNTPSYA